MVIVRLLRWRLLRRLGLRLLRSRHVRGMLVALALRLAQHRRLRRLVGALLPRLAGRRA